MDRHHHWQENQEQEVQIVAGDAWPLSGLHKRVRDGLVQCGSNNQAHLGFQQSVCLGYLRKTGTSTCRRTIPDAQVLLEEKLSMLTPQQFKSFDLSLSAQGMADK
jgi:hypothetical protein